MNQPDLGLKITDEQCLLHRLYPIAVMVVEEGPEL